MEITPLKDITIGLVAEFPFQEIIPKVDTRFLIEIIMVEAAVMPVQLPGNPFNDRRQLFMQFFKTHILTLIHPALIGVT
jgi:hypothetical protein